MQKNLNKLKFKGKLRVELEIDRGLKKQKQ